MGNRGGARHLLNGMLAADRSPSMARWIVCTLEDTPGSAASSGTSAYGKLFFLDEATALAAGHRPCWLCRQDATATFLDLWREVSGRPGGLDELDQQLWTQRNEPVRAVAEVAALPSGVFFRHLGSAFVVAGDRALRWTPTGYDGDVAVADLDVAEVLTPSVTIDVIRAGYPVETAVPTSPRVV